MVPVGARFCVRCKTPVAQSSTVINEVTDGSATRLDRPQGVPVPQKFSPNRFQRPASLTPEPAPLPAPLPSTSSDAASPAETEGVAVQGPLRELLHNGGVLDQKFRLNKEIGRGGMGFVYYATDLSLNRSVAVKILPPHYNEDESIVGRFQREARAMASLDHANIVTVYSIGFCANLHYFVMKLLEGETLAHTLKRVELGQRAPLSALEVIDLMVQACNGLEHAHQKSLLHRDIKPGNLMLSPSGKLTIMDFGIVKRLDDSDSVGLKTAHGKIFGTPEYMPPEQAMGKGDYSPASDLYALAVVGYELLCGELPYVADTPIAIIIQHIRSEVPNLKGRAKGQYPALEAFFKRALAKEPAERYISAGELRATLLSIRQSISSPVITPIDELSDDDLLDHLEFLDEIDDLSLTDDELFGGDLNLEPQVTQVAIKTHESELMMSSPLREQPLNEGITRELTSLSSSPQATPPIPPLGGVNQTSKSPNLPENPLIESRPTASLEPASSRPGHYKGLPFKRK